MRLKKILVKTLVVSMLITTVLPGLTALAYPSTPIVDTDDGRVNQRIEEETIERIKRAKEAETKNLSQAVQQGNEVLNNDTVQPAFIQIIMQALRLLYGATKIYDKVTEDYVENAIEDHFDVPVWANSTYNLADISIIGKNLTVNLEFGTQSYGFEHIVSKHHPKYWTGLGYRENNSFFNDSTSMDEIVDIIAYTLNASAENKNKVVLAKLSSSNTAIDATWSGNLYRVVIDSDLDVITCYPLGWNIADSE